MPHPTRPATAAQAAPTREKDRDPARPPTTAELEAAWRDQFRPANLDEEWLLSRMLMATIRMDDCRRREETLKAMLMCRAEVHWDDDRRAEVEAIGARLHRDPAGTVARLRLLKHGCDWLLARWKGLGRALGTPEAPRDWTPAQRALAHDLAGTPPPFRDQEPWDWPGHDGPAAMVAAEIAGLESRLREGLESLDRIERAHVARGSLERPHPELTRIRRETDGWRRQLNGARTRLERAVRLRGASQATPPAPVARREPADDRDERRTHLDFHGEAAPHAGPDDDATLWTAPAPAAPRAPRPGPAPSTGGAGSSFVAVSAGVSRC